VISINRVAKVVKGGRRFSSPLWSWWATKRDTSGWVSARRTRFREAIRKGNDQARKNLFSVPMMGATVPHEVVGQFGAGKVLLRPAAPGTARHRGRRGARVVESAGIQDILTKSLGSSNKFNVVNCNHRGPAYSACTRARRRVSDPRHRRSRGGLPGGRVRRPSGSRAGSHPGSGRLQ